MSQQVINISTPDDGLGDVLRNGFDKTNQNFTELYNSKVDKVTGKGLSENDFTDLDKAKLDGIEAGAEVNVKADWGETDPDADSFILNKPNSLYASVGHFHYADSATQTTPISIPSGVETKITNDTLGIGTEKDFAPYAVADIWEVADNAFTFSPLDLGDQVMVRFDFSLTSTSISQKFNLFIRFGVGSPSEYDLLVDSWVEKTIITNDKIIKTVIFSIDNEDWLFNLAEVYILSDDDASIKVNGFYTPIIRKSVNVINIEGDFLSSIISSYTSATTPLVGTELALIDDGTGFKKVAVSEFGSSVTWDLSDLTKYSIYAWTPMPASWVGYAPTIVGTADNISPIFTGTQVQKATRRRYVSASTSGSSVDFYDSAFRQTCMGCGFFFNIKFAFEDVSTFTKARSFAGLFNSLSVFGNVNPSTQFNIFGVGADSDDANLHLIHNDNIGTATKVDLGANFPANTSATDEYLFQCYNLQGETSSIWWRLINVTSMISTDWAEVTTDLPISTSGSYLTPRLWRNNSSVALAVKLSLMDMNLYKIL